MPRRRRFTAARAQQAAQKAAKKIKVPLPPKPNIRELKTLLNGVIAASVETRIRALVRVVEWYKPTTGDGAVDYLIKKSQGDVALAKELQDKLPKLSRANKARELGVNPGAGAAEREQALRTAVKQFELYCNKTVPDTIKDENKETEFKDKEWWTPRLDHYYRRYEEQKQVLEEKEKAIGAKYVELIQALSQAFTGVPIQFKINTEIQGRKYDGSGTMFYGRATADEMNKTLKREGILKIFSDEFIAVTTAMSLTRDVDGNPIKDPKAQVQAMDSVLKGFVAWAQSDQGPLKLLRKGAGNGSVVQQPPLPIIPVATPKAASTPKSNPASKPKSNNRVGGRYRPGSTIATLYERMSDQQEHTKQELFLGFKGCEAGHDAPFTRLLRHVGLFKEFRIEVRGDVVKMTLN